MLGTLTVEGNQAIVEHVTDTTQQVLANQESLRTLLFGIQSRVIPRIFALRPKHKQKDDTLWKRLYAAGKWMFQSPSNIGKEKVVLHFYCEAEIPHLAPHPGYTFTRTTDFMREYGPMIAASLQVLRFMLLVSPLPVGNVIPDEIISVFADNVNTFNQELCEYTKSLLESAADHVDKLSDKKKVVNGMVEVAFEDKMQMDEGMQRRFKGTLLVVCNVCRAVHWQAKCLRYGQPGLVSVQDRARQGQGRMVVCQVHSTARASRHMLRGAALGKEQYPHQAESVNTTLGKHAHKCLVESCIHFNELANACIGNNALVIHTNSETVHDSVHCYHVIFSNDTERGDTCW
jgi:hypothetical protein